MGSKGAVFGLAAVFGAITAWESMYVNKGREVALEVRFGQVVDVQSEPGIKVKIPFITGVSRYPLTRQTTLIGRGTTQRTSDDLRVTAPMTIEYEIDPSVASENEVGNGANYTSLQNLYFQLRDRPDVVDGEGQISARGGDLEDVVNRLARDASVRVYEGFTVGDLAEPGFTEQVTSGVKTKLQASLIEQGWPVRVINVMSDGFTLDTKSEAALAKIVDIRQENERLALREQNAQRAANTYTEEAEADLNYVQQFLDVGMPPEYIPALLQLRAARDAGRVMQPFAQVIGADFTDFPVAIDPSKAVEDRDNNGEIDIVEEFTSEGPS